MVIPHNNKFFTVNSVCAHLKFPTIWSLKIYKRAIQIAKNWRFYQKYIFGIKLRIRWNLLHLLTDKISSILSFSLKKIFSLFHNLFQTCISGFHDWGNHLLLVRQFTKNRSIGWKALFKGENWFDTDGHAKFIYPIYSAWKTVE